MIEDEFVEAAKRSLAEHRRSMETNRARNLLGATEPPREIVLECVRGPRDGETACVWRKGERLAPPNGYAQVGTELVWTGEVSDTEDE